ncbi:MAG: HEAT repeat domain-containing protein, partial [Salinarchaeum sp.]
MSGDAPTAESIRSQLADVENALDAAETEADLDDVESRLVTVADDLDALKATVEDETDDDADDDDAGVDIDALADDLDTLEADLEKQRGPYVSDVETTLVGAADAVEDRDLTDQGLQTVQSAVADTRVSLSLEVSPPEIDTAEETAIVSHIQALAAAAGERDLDPDADANRIASMLGTAESLVEAVEDAEVWSDLTVRQQLDRKGFYDSIEV